MPQKSRKKTATPKSASKPKAASAVKSGRPVEKPIKAVPPKKKAPVTPAKARPSGKSVAIAEGDIAPDFQLAGDTGEAISLAQFAGRKLVIFFYPRADTPGCTTEAKDFSRLAGAFGAAKTALLGVSADPVKAQARFRDKHQLTIALGSDEEHKMLGAYGAWGEKSMYGRNFMGVLRTTCLIDAQGRIARIWRNVKVDSHADDVLAATRGLK